MAIFFSVSKTFNKVRYYGLTFRLKQSIVNVSLVRTRKDFLINQEKESMQKRESFKDQFSIVQ